MLYAYAYHHQRLHYPTAKRAPIRNVNRGYLMVFKYALDYANPRKALVLIRTS